MPATKTKKRQSRKPVLTVDEAKDVLKRRAKRWLALNSAEQRLHTRRKGVEKDMRSLVKVMPKDKQTGHRTWESNELKLKHVPTTPIKKAGDEGEDNVALVAKTVKPEHLDMVMPRKLDCDVLETLYPDLHKKLKRGTGSRFEIDIKQAHVVNGNGQHS